MSIPVSFNLAGAKLKTMKTKLEMHAETLIHTHTDTWSRNSGCSKGQPQSPHHLQLVGGWMRLKQPRNGHKTISKGLVYLRSSYYMTSRVTKL